MLSGFVIPVGFSLLRFLPVPVLIRQFVYKHFIYPPAFGIKHARPLGGTVHMPTRGQALFIFYLIVVNTVLSLVDCDPISPNAWFASTKDEVILYIGNRTGVLSFANIPLLILYAGRNNVLLWLTDWSRETFLMLHKWTSWIATIQAVLHSILLLVLYVSDGTYYTDVHLPYWIWGVVATLCMCILLPLSIYPIRKAVYEFFLAWHVILTVFTIAGCYYHIVLEFQHQWGYETWMYVAIAVWGFDRTLRVLRLLKNGIRTAQITKLDDTRFKIDVEGIDGDGHVYLYFPTLTWKVWENHPFSILSNVLVSSSEPSSDSESSDSSKDIEKSARVTSSSAQSDALLSRSTTTGLSFLIRTSSGLTRLLSSHAKLPVLVEGPYSATPHTIPSGSLIIGVSGGVGVTAVLPIMQAHRGRTVLFWSARSQKLIDSVANAPATRGSAVSINSDEIINESNRTDGHSSQYLGAPRIVDDIDETYTFVTDAADEKHLADGAHARPDLAKVLQYIVDRERAELATSTFRHRQDIAVLVCGPDEMLDEARRVVGSLVAGAGIGRILFFGERFSF